jgi:hypothetical protein
VILARRLEARIPQEFDPESRDPRFADALDDAPCFRIDRKQKTITHAFEVCIHIAASTNST